MSSGAASGPAILQKVLALGTLLIGAESFWRAAKNVESSDPALAANPAKQQAEGFRLSINNLPRPSELPVQQVEELRR